MDTTSTPGTKWTAKQAYVLAVVCMLSGIPVGYLLRAPSTSAVRNAAQDSQQPVPGVAARADQITPEQLKHMADVQAEPLLAALRKDPNNPDVLAQAGSVYFRAHQFPIAVDYYERAMQIKPTADGLVSLSNSYHYAGSDDRAIETLKRALQIDPKSPNALFNLGMLNWQVRNDPKAAIELWQRMLKTNPNHPRRAEVESMIVKAKEHVKVPAGMTTAKPAL
ncbi:MAG: tetratricopeptide repeat protein [Acidobacteriia bacterium]|nr:tetratricopeptide repeat protein [Terriglobia bacterium]